MRITAITALAAATFALAPLAHAGEGNGDPFPFSAGPIGAVQFINGAAVPLPNQPVPSYAARDAAPHQPATEVAELPAERGSAESYAPGTSVESFVRGQT